MLDTDFTERHRAARTSSGVGLRSVTPGRVAFWGALSIVVVSTLLVARIAGRYGAFIGDDVVGFWLAHTTSLPRYLVTPIDVHFVPLHRLVNYVVFRLSPMNFRFGLGVLLLLHGAAAFALFRVVRDISNRVIASVLVCLYGVNVTLGSLLIWWTSGLHRLGCLAFVSLALLGYVRYRANANVRWLHLTVLATAAALGFYAKGVLIPVYIALIELNFVVALGRRAESRRLLWSLGATGAVVCAYVLMWLFATDAPNHSISFDPTLLAIFVDVGLKVFAPLAFGSWLRPDEAAVYVSVWLLLVAVTSFASPRALVAWGSLCAAVALNFGLIGLSGAKTRLYGASVLMSDRYYFEQVFLIVLFGAFAVQSGRDRFERWLPARGGRFALAAVVLGCLLVVAVQSKSTFRELRRKVYSDSKSASLYMANLRADLAALPPPARSPLSLDDTPVSTAVVPFGIIVSRNSQLLTLMGETVRVESGGAYRVKDDGHVVRAP